MLHYWWEVFWDGVWTSIEAIGQPLQVLLYSAFILVLGGFLIWRRHGWQAMKENIAKTLGEVLLVGAIAWIPFLLFYIARASYVRWKTADDEARRIDQDFTKYKEQTTKPQIVADIVETNIAPTSKKTKMSLYPAATEGNAIVTLIVRVKNLAMPSIAAGWKVHAKLKNGSLVAGTLLQIPATITLADGNGKVQKTIWAEDALYDKAFKSPLQTGAEIYGALLIYVPAPFEEVDKGTFVLEWNDVTDQTHSSESPYFGGDNLATYPGMRRN
jgi:hypothetical protein